MKLYTFLLHHDTGKALLSVMAANLETARSAICITENCPPCAVELYC